MGIAPIIGITSIYQYGDEMLVTRLGSGAGGKSILRIKHADEVNTENSAKYLDQTAKEKFQLFCSRCHGAAGSPGDAPQVSEAPLPRDFTDPKWQSEVSESQIKKAIRDGAYSPENVVLMPPWKNILSEKEIEEMVTVIREFGQKN